VTVVDPLADVGGPYDNRFMHVTPTVLVLLVATGATTNVPVIAGVELMFSAQAAGGTSNDTRTPQETAPPVLAETTADKTRIKIRPILKKEPEYVRSASAIESGEFGEVLISGILGEDGKVYQPIVKVSSRSQIIDEQALSDVPSFLFSPARDADGKALRIPINISLEYGHVDFRGSNGLAQYRCNQAVKDYDWWWRTWPTGKKDRIYGTIKGVVTMRALRAGNRESVNFDDEWKAAIEACRKEPDRRFLDLLKPDGDFVRSMTKS